MTIDRALELAEHALRSQRRTQGRSPEAIAENEEALKIIGALRDPSTTLGRLFRIEAA